MNTLKGLKTPTDIALKICNDYINTNLSQNKIAIKHNVSKSTVANIRKEYNIPPREKDKIRDTSEYQTCIECNDDYFENIDSADKSYWLGFILGDAYLGKDGCTIKLELHYDDLEILEKLKACLESDHKISFRSRVIKETGNLRKSYTLSICRKKLYDDLIRNGIPMTKSKYCTIPSSIPKKFIRDFIRGIFDSDGGWHLVDKNQVIFSICSSVKSFLEEIQTTLISECDLHKTKISSNRNNTCHELRYCGNTQAVRLFEYLYANSNLKLMRKYDAIIKHFNSKYITFSLSPWLLKQVC